MERTIFGLEYRFATKGIYAGNDIDQDSGAIKWPNTMATSYSLPYHPADLKQALAKTGLEVKG